MEYLIFIFISTTFISFWHFNKYRKSDYQKFEDYLNVEVNELIRNLITAYFIICGFSIIIGSIILGGQIVRYLLL